MRSTGPGYRFRAERPAAGGAPTASAGAAGVDQALIELGLRGVVRRWFGGEAGEELVAGGEGVVGLNLSAVTTTWAGAVPVVAMVGPRASTVIPA